MRKNIVLLAAVALGALGGCAREDADCAAAEKALGSAAYRAELKKAVERQFEAGELGPLFEIGGQSDMPGKYSVVPAPEFRALHSKPLHQRIIVDARHNIAAVFVGWAKNRGVVIDVQPNDAIVPTIEYGDGVSFICGPESR